MATITSANAVLMLSIGLLYPTPRQLQGFATDDVFDTDSVSTAEVMMGVDGKQSSGFIYVSVPQNVMLQADSASCQLFEDWYAAQQAAVDTYTADGTISLPSVGRKYAMRNGVLTGFTPTASAKKVLQPRRFTITWESISPAPF